MTISSTEQPWYYSIPPSPQDDPWNTWREAIARWPAGSLEAQVESDVEESIKLADDRRLSVWRGLTLAGVPIWDGFRKRHTELDECWGYRRDRYLIWRAAALKTMRESALYRTDPVDGKLVDAKLLATYRELWPLDIDGCDPKTGISLWHPHGDWPFHHYAADVLSLFTIEFPNKTVH